MDTGDEGMCNRDVLDKGCFKHDLVLLSSILSCIAIK